MLCINCHKDGKASQLPACELTERHGFNAKSRIKLQDLQQLSADIDIYSTFQLQPLGSSPNIAKAGRITKISYDECSEQDFEAAIQCDLPFIVSGFPLENECWSLDQLLADMLLVGTSAQIVNTDHEEQTVNLRQFLSRFGSAKKPAQLRFARLKVSALCVFLDTKLTRYVGLACG